MKNNPGDGDRFIEKKFAWLPVQLGDYNIYGLCTIPTKKIWLESYIQFGYYSYNMWRNKVIETKLQ
jgi:hypothetical protein